MRSIKERVDVLLREGVAGISKWAIKHTYAEPKVADDAFWSHEQWYDEWKKLRAHHLEETNFFLEVIEELRTRLNERERNDD